MRFDKFVDNTVNEGIGDMVANIAQKAKFKALDAGDSALEKIGSSKATGRKETREAVATLHKQFGRYLGRQGIKNPKKDDIVLFMQNIGLVMSEEKMISMIYPKSSATFTGSAELKKMLDSVYDFAKQNKEIPSDIVAKIQQAAGNDASEGMVRFGLLKTARKFPRAKALIPLQELIGGSKVTNADLNEVFTALARSTTIADDANRKRYRERGGTGDFDANSANILDDAEEAPAYLNASNGTAIKQIIKKHGISLQQMVSLAAMADREDALTRKCKIEFGGNYKRLGLAITLLQFFARANDKRGFVVIKDSMGDGRPNMKNAIDLLSVEMNNKNGFSRAKCVQILDRALHKSTSNGPENEISFLVFVIRQLNNGISAFKQAVQRYKINRGEIDNDADPIESNSGGGARDWRDEETEIPKDLGSRDDNAEANDSGEQQPNDNASSDEKAETEPQPADAPKPADAPSGKASALYELVKKSAEMTSGEYRSEMNKLFKWNEIEIKDGVARLFTEEDDGGNRPLVGVKTGGKLAIVPSHAFSRGFAHQFYKITNSKPIEKYFELKEDGDVGTLSVISPCIAEIIDGEIVVKQKGKLSGFSA